MDRSSKYRCFRNVDGFANPARKPQVIRFIFIRVLFRRRRSIEMALDNVLRLSLKQPVCPSRLRDEFDGDRDRSRARRSILPDLENICFFPSRTFTYLAFVFVLRALDTDPHTNHNFAVACPLITTLVCAAWVGTTASPPCASHPVSGPEMSDFYPEGECTLSSRGKRVR